MRTILITILILGLRPISLFSQKSIELKTFAAEEARQGVAVDKEYIYVISNQKIVKRDKSTGKIIKAFESADLIHLNSGIVYGKKLYCAHSNDPDIPMTGSIEVWDTKNMEHCEIHSFGIDIGQCTWMVQFEGNFYLMFVHYSQGRGQKNRGVSWSQLVKFDKNWKRIEAWILPKDLIAHLEPKTLSGGLITPNGKILCTHQNYNEIYVLEFPKIGSQLKWVKTIETSIPGQAIALDPYEKNVIWGIDKHGKKVLKTKLDFIP